MHRTGSYGARCKNVICNNEELDSLLEDMSLYWNDDKYIVDTFVLKTIKRFRRGVKEPIRNFTGIQG